MYRLVTLATLLLICVLPGCKHTPQRSSNDPDASTAEKPQENVEAVKPPPREWPEIASEAGPEAYPAMNHILEFPDSTIASTIPLPLTLDGYLNKYGMGVNPGYQPADRLLAFLQTIGFDGSEYDCQLLPFINRNILPLLLWVCLGDNEYYLILTVDVHRGNVIDLSEAGEVTDTGIISFLIDEEFRITRFKAQIGYDESKNTYHIVDKERLNSYRIGADGMIGEQSLDPTH